ncbi:hypothetical protein B0H12DRAFT_712815 [Mycena haematopus]|nr:hypothetical protein B0H12DRAFT_712815 [Mycena haematopus]
MHSRLTPYSFPIITLACYLSAIPVLTLLASPTGLGAKILTPLLANALRRVSNGRSSVEQNPQKAVALLTLFYVFALFILSATMSATGQLLGNKTGYKNKEPRIVKRTITSGLPHRMIATHEALYDIFPAYAIAAALFASAFTGPLALSVPSASIALNALVLHVFLKLFVYTPSYLLNVDLVRSYSHMCAVAAVMLAIWGIVVG